MRARHHEVTRLEGFADAVFGIALAHNKFFRRYGLQDAWSVSVNR
jgi:hypothetical protein